MPARNVATSSKLVPAPPYPTMLPDSMPVTSNSRSRSCGASRARVLAIGTVVVVDGALVAAEEVLVGGLEVDEEAPGGFSGAQAVRTSAVTSRAESRRTGRR